MRSRADRLLDDADRQPFLGWDFSWLEGRLESLPLPWDYTAIVLEQARRSLSLIDLGTGGGEWLAALPYRPPLTVATEAWPPNVAIARGRLALIGVHVVQVAPARDNSGKPVDDARVPLPFARGSFELVSDRHEAFDVHEVARILAPGGSLVTQQVDSGNDDEYRALLGVTASPAVPSDRWETWMPVQLERAGLEVVQHRSAPLKQLIHDVGALAYGLKAIPWMVPGFSIREFRPRLHEIQARIDRDGPITVRQRRFFVRARKPA